MSSRLPDRSAAQFFFNPYPKTIFTHAPRQKKGGGIKKEVMKVVKNELRMGRKLITLPDIERFFGSVTKSDGCWDWTGFLDAAGYGRITLGYIPELTHVVSYLLHKGAIPKKLHVLHSCDNRCCVNPDHLWLGTHQDNMTDMIQKGRHAINNGFKGEDSNLSKLTQAQVDEIRKCVKAGAKQKDMAKRFCVRTPAISLIINNKTWKQVI